MTHLPVSATLLALQGGFGSSPMTAFLFQIVAIFLIFYFLMIRPQQKQRRQHAEQLRNLKRGDQVVTAGGVVGEIVAIKEVAKDPSAKPGAAVVDDWITIKSGESRLVVERARIARVITPTVSTPTSTSSTK